MVSGINNFIFLKIFSLSIDLHPANTSYKMTKIGYLPYNTRMSTRLIMHMNCKVYICIGRGCVTIFPKFFAVQEWLSSTSEKNNNEKNVHPNIEFKGVSYKLKWQLLHKSLSQFTFLNFQSSTHNNCLKWPIDHKTMNRRKKWNPITIHNKLYL